MRIRVVAPGAAVKEEKITAAAEVLEASGHVITFGAHTFQRHRYLAGRDELRLEDLRSAMTDKTVDAVWFARGGTGCMYLLPHVADWLAHKPIIGYSDNCSLLLQEWKLGGCAIHGPVFEEIVVGDAISQHAEDVLTLLSKGSAALHFSGLTPGGNLERVNVTGPALGGNLATLSSLAGTPWLPSMAGGIVLLEDVGEPFYRIERSLAQLRLCGALDGALAVVLGDFTNCPARGVLHTLEEIFAEHLNPLNIPIYCGAPFGHGQINRPWQLGRIATITDSSLAWHD